MKVSQISENYGVLKGHIMFTGRSSISNNDDMTCYLLAKYRKYKPLTVPRKCNVCSQKTVKAAYRTICTSCANSQKVCAGCGKPRNGTEAQTPHSDDVVPGETRHRGQEDVMIQEVLKSLTERQKRTALRRQERGEDILTVLSQLGDVDLSEDSDSADNPDDAHDVSQ